MATTQADVKRSLNYRLAGMTYRQIAKQLDVSVRTAHSLVKKALDEYGDAVGHDEAYNEELAAISAMQMGLWKQAATGDTRAVNSTLALMRRRSEIALARSLHEHDTSEAEVVTVIDELAKRRKAREAKVTKTTARGK